MYVYKFLCEKFGLKSLREQRLKIAQVGDLNDPFELLPFKCLNKRQREALRNTRDRMAERRGMVCFSATWRDPVMWAHYSDKHRGLCLGFQVPRNKCRRIRYTAERLPFPKVPTRADAEALLFTKYKNWEYEQEMRMWARLEDQEAGLYFADFDPALQLSSVIVGARCEISDVDLSKALGAQANKVRLVRSRASFIRFEIVGLIETGELVDRSLSAPSRER
jgi:hypothetical protein